MDDKVTIDGCDLESILMRYFGCKKVYRDKPKVVYELDEERTEYLTEEGFKAYGKLVDLLYELSNLTECYTAVEDIVETLDDIVNNPFY